MGAGVNELVLCLELGAAYEGGLGEVGGKGDVFPF